MSESHGSSSAEDKILPQCSQKDVAKKKMRATKLGRCG